SRISWVRFVLEDDASKHGVVAWFYSRRESRNSGLYALIEGSQLLAALGDRTVIIWSVGNRKCIGLLFGHTGSVKSLPCHSSNP
ncbi:hypothetical protein ACJX0J_028785, partial [Zea mays]